MAISKEEIEKLAWLARLRFSEEELERFTGEFDAIIAFADTINESVSGKTEQIRSVGSELVSLEELRADEVVPSLPAGRIVSYVEDANGFFRVKRSRK
jgi:aspartyl-tRNA(Asn)/glutamyl-tRNA(Gln) amidotransferase subunit C